MILRKKNKQVSVLHVYHHVMLIWAWFLVCKFHCGGDAYFGALANSFIHVVMYSYYLSALVGIRCPWKKYITQLQLLQFVVCFSHAMFVIYAGTVPTWLCMCQVWVMLNMLVLFGNFYMKAYTKKKATSGGSIAEEGQVGALMKGKGKATEAADTPTPAAAAIKKKNL